MYRRWYFWAAVITIAVAIVFILWPAPIRQSEPDLPDAGPVERTPKTLPLEPADDDAPGD